MYSMMKPLKIGKIIIHKKALGVIAFCLLLNGISIGALVASNHNTEESISLFLLLIVLLLPYVLFYKKIAEHIEEVK